MQEKAWRTKRKEKLHCKKSGPSLKRLLAAGLLKEGLAAF